MWHGERNALVICGHIGLLLGKSESLRLCRTVEKRQNNMKVIYMYVFLYIGFL